MGSRGSSVTNTILATHITSDSNINNILKNDFNLELAGSEAGSSWGNAIYYSQDDLSQQFYKSRLNSNVAIKSTIDSSNMLTVNIDGIVKSPMDMYNKAIKSFSKEQQSTYNKLKSAYKKNAENDYYKKAFEKVAKDNYKGLIINQTNTNGKMDILTGGNQIVIYDKSIIKNKRKVNI